MLLPIVLYGLFLILNYLIWGMSGPPISEVTIFTLWLFVNVTDALSTYLVIKEGGGEANPFARWLFKKLGGPLPSLPIKLAIAILFGHLFWFQKIMMLSLTFVFAAVSIGNYRIYRKLRKPSVP